MTGVLSLLDGPTHAPSALLEGGSGLLDPKQATEGGTPLVEGAEAQMRGGDKIPKVECEMKWVVLASVVALAATACTNDPDVDTAKTAVGTTPSPESSTVAGPDEATTPAPAASRASVDTTPADNNRNHAVDGPVMRHPARSNDDDGMDAAIRGVLQLEGSCLLVRPDDVGERYPIVWPAGTSRDAERQSVVLPRGDKVAIGDAVDGGDEYLYVADVERIGGREASSLAADCVDNTYGEIAVVNNHDTAIRPGRR